MGRVFTNGLGDLGSIPGCVISKTLKMVLDTSLLTSIQENVFVYILLNRLSILAEAFLPEAQCGFLSDIWLECSPMARETRVQSQVESYQRLKKWYLMPPCLTLSNIRYVSRVKWSNPGKGVAPFPTPQCSSYWNGSFWVALNYSRQLYLHWVLRLYSWSSGVCRVCLCCHYSQSTLTRHGNTR